MNPEVFKKEGVDDDQKIERISEVHIDRINGVDHFSLQTRKDIIATINQLVKVANAHEKELDNLYLTKVDTSMRFFICYTLLAIGLPLYVNGIVHDWSMWTSFFSSIPLLAWGYLITREVTK